MISGRVLYQIWADSKMISGRVLYKPLSTFKSTKQRYVSSRTKRLFVRLFFLIQAGLMTSADTRWADDKRIARMRLSSAQLVSASK
jgi:hypothetical protein